MNEPKNDNPENNLAKNLTDSAANAATKKAAKVAADSIAGPAGGAAVELLSKTKLGKAILDKSAKKIKLFIILFMFFSFIFFLILFVIFAGTIAKENDSNTSLSDSLNLQNECGFSIKSTSLSKDAYIDAIKKYSENNSISEDFVNKAGDIYDLAISKNLNPELVIVRAISEGGINNTTGKNNHWGIGCTNTGGLSACHNYNSFIDGVEGFLNNISKYDSLESMMSKYAYIGKYWYNPGSAGKGGCYYHKIIYPDGIPERVKTACSDKYKGCSGSKCVKTTTEDQQAYAKWQVNKMAEHREKVFGLKSNEGVSCSTSTGEDINNETGLSEYPLQHKNLKVLHSPLPSSDVEKINKYIKESINKAGYGTGNGVAAAASAFILGVAEKGYYVPYYAYGGHSRYSAPYIIGFYPNLGQKLSKCTSFDGSSNNNYCYSGFDCSGFVSWAIKNACNSNFKDKTTSGFASLGKKTSLDKVKPGDILVAKGDHIILVVKNNNGTIIFAESHGNHGKKDYGGAVFSSSKDSETLNSHQYVARDMSGWYSTNCKKSG